VEFPWANSPRYENHEGKNSSIETSMWNQKRDSPIEPYEVLACKLLQSKVMTKKRLNWLVFHINKLFVVSFKLERVEKNVDILSFFLCDIKDKLQVRKSIFRIFKSDWIFQLIKISDLQGVHF
jgi:hypothetical protein